MMKSHSLKENVDELGRLSLNELQALRRRTAKGHQHRGPRAPAIEPQPRSGDLPLSFAQERLWFLDQLGLVGAAYNTVMALRLEGVLDVEALERSLTELIRRHEILRTRYKANQGIAIQIIDPPAPLSLPIQAILDVPEQDRAQCIAGLSDRERQRPFDLEKGPLVRATLLRLAAEDHALLLSIHHIACDGWSFAIVKRELASLYSALSQGQPPPVAELGVQYADYALWQRQWLQGEVLQNQQRYWREHLLGAPPQLELPTDRLRPAVESYKGAIVRTSLSHELSDRLNALGRANGATLFMVMLAAYQLLLSRWSGQKDIVVGTPIAGRSRRELDGLIGFFVNTLALRAEVCGERAFREHLVRVRELTLQAYAHQDLPFEAIVKELCPDRNLSRQPVFQVMLTLQHLPEEPPALPQMHWTSVEGDNSTTHFDLNLSLTETARGISMEFQYATDLFDAETIRRMAGHYRQLLEGVVADPECPIARIALLDDAERLIVLQWWNDTSTAFPNETLHRLFEEQTRRTPHAVAVSCGDVSLSYKELNERANRLARYLVSKGIGPDRLVALCMDRGADILVGILGILKSGGAYVPLDMTNPQARLGHILSDAQPKVILTQRSLSDMIPATAAQVIDLESQWDLISGYSGDDLDTRSPEPDPENLAYVIYTSGSTGTPKGVMVSHRAIVNYSVDVIRRFDLTRGNGSLIATSFSFDLMLTGLYPPLLAGRTVRLVPAHGSHELLEEISKCDNLAPLKLTPSHLPMLEAALEKKQLDGRVGVLVLGGEPLLAAAVRPLKAAAREVRIFNHYGPTEATVGCVVNEVTHLETGRVPIGRPISNVRILILDGLMQPVPLGITGDIYVGGAGLARGYLNRPGLTAERFCPDPFSPNPGARLYATGDRGRWLPEGKIDCLGRADHQVKVRGYRIEPGEIESQLLQHPHVKEAAVIVRDDGGGPGAQLVAYVVIDPSTSVSIRELREHIRGLLPEYMVPSVWMLLEQLPLTPNGKLDRAALPIPKQQMEETSIKPRTDLERALANIWAEVLQRDEIGVRESFFDLGGHSLLATRVISRIRERLHIDLPLRTLFEMPTVEQLASRAAEEVLRLPERDAVDVGDLTESLWEKINEMSDEEVAASLEALQEERATPAVEALRMTKTGTAP
jgi:amino acid adenylation domain-containing protein